MSREAQRLQSYLCHILEAIDRIQRYAADLKQESFAQSLMVQDAVIRNLEIIGEACRNIERHAPDFAAAHPDLPLASAYEMRNALSHGYFSVDLGIVWTTIQNDLPLLQTKVQELLARLNEADSSAGP